MKNQKSLTNKGFSLVELIIVVAIMAILIGVLAPQYLRYVEKSRHQKDNTSIGEIADIMKMTSADENLIAAMGTGVTLTFDGPTGAFQGATAGGADAAGLTTINNELKATLGDPLSDIKLTSNAYKGTAFTINVSIDSSTKVITVTSANWIEPGQTAPNGTKTF